MKTYDVPDWLIQRINDFRTPAGLRGPEFHLYAALRAVGWVRMAADALESDLDCRDFDWDLKVAEYHTYAGVCAARTALDAIASWLRVWLLADQEPYRKPSWNTNLTLKLFRDAVSQALAGPVRDCFGQKLEALGCLGAEIDGHRQRAAHREGLALVLHGPAPTRWHLAPKGLRCPREDNVDLAQLLRGWADQIEADLRGILEEIPRQPQR